jgi:hypothetical protein
MAIATTPPAPDSYDFVLMRTDRDASARNGMPMRFCCYHENTTSRSIEWGGKRVHMLFLKQPETAKRAWRLGWKNITDAWRAKLQRETPTATTEAQRAILAALTSDWQPKAEIVAIATIKDTEWRTAIRYLIDKGLAETNATKHMSNRQHAYRLASASNG